MFSSVATTVRSTLAATMSLLFVACANTASDPGPLQRGSSAQTDESGLVCGLPSFAMSHCAYDRGGPISEAECESGERILHVYYEIEGNIFGDPLTAGYGYFVARLSYDDGRVTYGLIDDPEYNRKDGVTFGYIPTYAFCEIERDATVQPQVLEIGFRSKDTGAIVPLAGLEVVQTPQVSLHDVDDCSEVEVPPSPPVVWRERQFDCLDFLVWPDDIQWPSEPEDWPEEGASYRSVPMRAVNDEGELAACNEGDTVEYVHFESSDTRLRHFLLYLYDHIRETMGPVLSNPEYDIVLSTVVDVVDANGSVYRGDAVISAQNETRASRRQGTKGSVPVDRFTWRSGAPPSDQYVSIQQFYLSVPSLYTGETWTFNMPGEPIWVMWPQFQEAQFAP